MRRQLYLPALAGSLMLALILARNPILLGLGRFLVVKDEPLRPAELIHVLGGGFDRLDYALSLYQQRYAPRLFVTGDSDARFYQRYLVAKGAAPADLAPDSSWATSTYEEALELRQFLHDEPAIQSIIVVSSPYHMRRASWTFDRVLDDRVSLQFAPVPFEITHTKQEWWKDVRSRHAVKDEYLKNLYYRLRY